MFHIQSGGDKGSFVHNIHNIKGLLSFIFSSLNLVFFFYIVDDIPTPGWQEI